MNFWAWTKAFLRNLSSNLVITNVNKLDWKKKSVEFVEYSQSFWKKKCPNWSKANSFTNGNRFWNIWFLLFRWDSWILPCRFLNSYESFAITTRWDPCISSFNWCKTVHCSSMREIKVGASHSRVIVFHNCEVIKLICIGISPSKMGMTSRFWWNVILEDIDDKRRNNDCEHSEKFTFNWDDSNEDQKLL
jgi:hypothetical protein